MQCFFVGQTKEWNDCKKMELGEVALLSEEFEVQFFRLYDSYRYTQLCTEIKLPILITELILSTAAVVT